MSIGGKHLWAALALAVAAAAMTATARGGDPVALDYRGEMWLNASSGSLAPYGILANRYATATQANAAMLRGSVRRDYAAGARLTWTAGADLLLRASSPTGYARYSPAADDWGERSLRPACANVQQLFAGVRFRSVFAIAGMRERPSALLNDSLTSGDLTLGINARPMPGLAAGLWRFVDVPFTRGALQIAGEVFYGRPLDDQWTTDHFNYYTSNLTTDWWYNYKRCYFRTKPSLALSVTFGMQAAAQTGYHYRLYAGGQLIAEQTDRQNLWEAAKAIVPRTGSGYWEGNHLGSWDLLARYRLRGGSEVKAYFQWPWEDGSGIGRRNGWDGLWGLEYVAANREGLLTGALVEYIDFTNQSGPVHWAPADHPGTTITSEATGSDSYYNNYCYNGYAYYGMGLGTPFLPSTIYNRDGYMRYVDTRVRGVHAAAMGRLGRHVDYRAMLSYRQGWGDYYAPRRHKVHDLSWTVEAGWRVAKVPGLKVVAIASMDRGDMLGNNFGAALSISYSGTLTFSRHGK